MTRGRFITFEGGEGAGKSTQVKRLAEFLKAAGIDCLTTREPGGSPAAEEIRRLLVEGHVGRWDGLTEVLLHYAARHEHLTTTVFPALERGVWVVCDRFADSTMAYQGYGHGVDTNLIAQAHRLVVGDFQPDLTIVLDIAPNIGLNRTQGRDHAEDRYERMGGDFHSRLRQGFLDIAHRHPERCVVVDAAMDEESLAAGVRKLVGERLGISA